MAKHTLKIFKCMKGLNLFNIKSEIWRWDLKLQDGVDSIECWKILEDINVKGHILTEWVKVTIKQYRYCCSVVVDFFIKFFHFSKTKKTLFQPNVDCIFSIPPNTLYLSEVVVKSHSEPSTLFFRGFIEPIPC